MAGDSKKEPLKFEIQEEVLVGTKIKVIGVGGGGANAVARMMSEGVTGVEFHVLNTDLQALQASPVPNKLAIGRKVTNGLGAGSDPSIGRLAALEDTEKIIEILEGADMVFVTAGMGAVVGLVLVGVYRLNRAAVRDNLEPRRRELQGLLAGLRDPPPDAQELPE